MEKSKAPPPLRSSWAEKKSSRKAHSDEEEIDNQTATTSTSTNSQAEYSIDSQEDIIHEAEVLAMDNPQLVVMGSRDPDTLTLADSGELSQPTPPPPHQHTRATSDRISLKIVDCTQPSPQRVVRRRKPIVLRGYHHFKLKSRRKSWSAVHAEDAYSSEDQGLYSREHLHAAQTHHDAQDHYHHHHHHQSHQSHQSLQQMQLQLQHQLQHQHQHQHQHLTVTTISDD
eukprot:TRINITY_DN1953_c0_g1_i1.p1 TRINITY_DN1953_c0_g1~~TRINITY_DN1953_c0_g1_i1.p1  ORF type:complete len:227 (+),score=51.98 TRINITY_DN1953_c0_g1_i1:55-735(+)